MIELYNELLFSWKEPGVVTHDATYAGNAYALHVTNAQTKTFANLLENGRAVYTVDTAQEAVNIHSVRMFPLELQLLCWGDVIVRKMTRRCTICRSVKLIIPAITPHSLPLPDICYSCGKSG